MALDITNNESLALFPHSSASFPMSVESATSTSTSSTPTSTHEQIQSLKLNESSNLQSRPHQRLQSLLLQSQHNQISENGSPTNKSKSTTISNNTTYHHVFKIVPSSGSTTTLNSINYTYYQFDKLTVQVPLILLHCFDYIHRHPSVEGIFRINGSVKRINHVYQHLVNNGFLDDDSLASFPFTLHDICGVTKKFLKTFLPSINELFNDGLLNFFQSIYDEYNNIIKNIGDGGVDGNDDKSSVESFKTASGSMSSNVNSPLDHLLSRFITTIIDQNTRFKNDLFFYIVYNLHRLSALEPITKMSGSNFSIVFQPYLFNTTNLTLLVMLQEFLNVLIGNYPQLISRYSQIQLTMIPINTSGHTDDVTSINSVESLNVLPITNNSQVQHYDHIFDNLQTTNPDDKSSPPQHHQHQQQQLTSTASKRRSLSNRFSALLDGYYAPTNKKRFSFGLATTPLPVVPTEPAPVTAPIIDAKQFHQSHQEHPTSPSLPFHKSTEMLIDLISKAEQDSPVVSSSQLVVPKSRSASTGTGNNNDITSISTDNEEYSGVTELTPDLIGSGYSTYPNHRLTSRTSSYQGKSTDQLVAATTATSSLAGGSRHSSFARSNDHLVGSGAFTNGGSRQSSIVRSSEQLLFTGGNKSSSNGISRNGSLLKPPKFIRTNSSLPLKSNDSLIQEKSFSDSDKLGDSVGTFNYDPNSTAASTTSKLSKEESGVKHDAKSKRRSFRGLFKKNNSSSSVVSTPRHSTYIPNSIASPTRPLSPSLVASAPYTPEIAQTDVMPSIINNDSPAISDYKSSKTTAATPRTLPSPLLNASKGSVDDILLTNHENSLANPEQKQLMLGRNFSLRGRSKRY